MKVTSQMKGWLTSQKGVKPDATEQECMQAIAAAMVDKSLTHEKYLELTTDKEGAAGGNAFKSAIDVLMDGQKKINERLDSLANPGSGLRSNAPAMPDLEKAFAGGTGSADPHAGTNHKPAHKSYDTSKKALLFPERTNKGMGVPHPFAGQEVFEGEGHRRVQSASELEKALAGVYIKMAVTNNGHKTEGVPRQFHMSAHDHELKQHMLENYEWGGTINAGRDGFGENPGHIGLGNASGGQKLNAYLQKAVLDDSTSGGLEAAPIFFDDMLIQTPLLHSEFFPKVKLVNITRGRRIEAASIGTVTITASTEGTAISLFNTANFIAAFDTTIFVASGAIELGLDFLSDSPLDIAGVVAANYQEVLLTWLDANIIGGDGTTEPEGLLNATGTVTINSTNGAGGPWTVGDVEALLFGVTKAYKGITDPNRIGFASLEATYRRIRGIAVSTTDQRRVFGMTHEDYKVLMRFWGIGASGTGGFSSNRQALFANFSRYRMYRRLGLTVTTEQAGYTLRRANTMLIIARSRWGGHLESGSAVALCTDGQS